MSRLTHRTSAGWTYFVTTKAFQSANAFQVHEVASIVIGKLLEYRDKGNYLLHEFVLMPNHFACLDYSVRYSNVGKVHAIDQGWELP